MKFRACCKELADDIIFGATNEILCEEFLKLMQEEFEMGMMGELKFFLELQIKQSNDGIFIHQVNYAKELLKKFKLDDYKKHASSMNPTFILNLDEYDKKKSNEYGLTGYCDAHYTRDRVERKNTSEGCHFIGANLVSRDNKRQGTIVMSTAKAEYIFVARCYSQLLWIKH
ncbi:hypothetical protein CR513_10319, partial [Mucuna pruriens]